MRGVWSCMKFELQQMRKQGSGAIVNCSSLGGLVGGAERGTYHAANHGVLGLTKIAALEYAARSRGARIQECGSGVRTKSWTTLEVVHVFIRRPRSSGSALHQVRQERSGNYSRAGISFAQELGTVVPCVR
nr:MULTISPECIES: SDR family NAD(P)-dependent oxidoreductase [Burkholderia]